MNKRCIFKTQIGGSKSKTVVRRRNTSVFQNLPEYGNEVFVLCYFSPPPCSATQQDILKSILMSRHLQHSTSPAPALLNRDSVKTSHSRTSVLTRCRFFPMFLQARPKRTSQLVPFDSGLSSNAVFPALPLVISQSRPGAPRGFEGVWMRQKRRFIILLVLVTRSCRPESGTFGGVCQYKV